MQEDAEVAPGVIRRSKSILSEYLSYTEQATRKCSEQSSSEISGGTEFTI